MHERSRSSSECPGGELPDLLQAALGAGFDDDTWFFRLGARVRPLPLGAIGPFELLAEAGRGGQGLVYRARQARPARDVALKRLAAGAFATPSMRARFEREIEAAAALDHPNIVSVYGTHEIDGQLVVALQWIDGQPFDRWARPPGTEPRGPDEIARVFAKVCGAVHHAHQRGVIHRDLKPSNILVDAAGEPHVLDFGLARRTGEFATDATLTQAGGFVGTPAFASPEQLRGDAARVDVRSDAYSLGALLFLALTGQLHAGESASPADLLREVESREPPWPDRLNPAVDRALASIVVKAIQPDPTYRYSSVEALLTDVQRYLGGELVLAHPPDWRYRTGKLLRRYRWPIGIGGGLATVLLSATLFSTWQYLDAVEARRQVEQALLNEQDARRASDRAAWTVRSVNTFLQDLFESAGEGRVQGASLTVEEVVARAAQKLDAAVEPLDPAAEAELRMLIGKSLRRTGRDAASVPHFERALALRRELHGEVSLPVAETLDMLGRVYRVTGRLTDAERAAEAAWEVYGLRLNSADPFFAVAANTLGLVKRRLGKLEEAERWYLEALRRYAAFGPVSAYLPSPTLNLGLVYLSMNRPADAERRFREALALCQKLYPQQDHLDHALAQQFLAIAVARQGDPQAEADQCFQAALDQFAALYGSRHARTRRALDDYSRFLQGPERGSEAVELLAGPYGESIAAGDCDAMLQIGARLATLFQGDGNEATSLWLALDLLALCPLESTDDFTPAARAALGEILLAHGHLNEACEQLQWAAPRLANHGELGEALADGAQELLARLLEGEPHAPPPAGPGRR